MSSAAGDAVGVLDRMTCILEAFDGDDRGMGISELGAARGSSEVDGLAAGRDPGAPAVSRARRQADPPGSAALRARAARRAAPRAQDRRAAGHGRPSQPDRRERASGASATDSELVCIAVMRGRSAAPSTVRTGGRLPLHATALGKAVLAHDSPSGVEDVLSAGLAPWTTQTITDPAALRRQLAGIRGGGLAVEAGEFADRRLLHRDRRCSRPGVGWQGPCRSRGTRTTSTRTASHRRCGRPR